MTQRALSHPNQRYHLTDDIRAKLFAEYTGKPGQITAFAQAFGVPISTVQGWLWTLGIRQSMRAYRTWTDDEVRVLQEHYFTMALPDLSTQIGRSVDAINAKMRELQQTPNSDE